MLSLFDILSDAASLRLSVPAEGLCQPGMLQLELLCSLCHPPWAAEPNQGSRQGLQELKKKKKTKCPLFSSSGFPGEGGLASFAFLFSVVCCSTNSKYTSRGRIVFHVLVDV